MKVGLFGFGKTGQAVARSLLTDPDVELVWVARQSASKFASAKNPLSIESGDEAFMVNLSDISAEELFSLHPVDAVIDFSATATLAQYGHICARKRIAIVSAVSNYDENTLEVLQKLSTKTPCFMVTKHHSRDKFFVPCCKSNKRCKSKIRRSGL